MRLRRRQPEPVPAETVTAAAVAERIAIAIEESATVPEDHSLNCPCPRCARWRQSRTDAETARRIGAGL